MSDGRSAQSVYSTIVADPPWDHSDGTGFSLGNKDVRTTGRSRSGKHPPSTHSIPYPTMSVEEICALKVPAADNAHLYLWTTNRYLEDAYRVARAWGFKPSTLLVWCKPQNQGVTGGAFLSNVEYVLFARRGTLAHGEKVGTRWFTWPRPSHRVGNAERAKAHSSKPEAFLDLVERVSPGPYLEMFARRNRLGWFTWGNESLVHEEIA